MAKIAHLGKYLPPVAGGMETSVLFICRLISAKHEVLLIGSNTERRRTWERLSPRLMLARITRWKVLFSTPITTGTTSLVWRFRPDLIHFHHPNPWLTPLLLFFPNPIVITYHCDIVNYRWSGRIFQPFLMLLLKKADKIIVTSASTLKSSPVLRKIDPRKIEVVHLAVDETRFAKSEPQRIASFRERFGPKYALFVGRLVKYKGLPQLLDAMTKVENCQLVIAGDGPERAYLQGLIAEKKLGSRVHMIGAPNDEELGDLFRGATMCVLPSINRAETLGISIMEGLSFARPLVTTKLDTGVREVNLHNVTGLEVDLDSVPQLAEAISRIAGDDLLRERLSSQARRHFQNRFSSEEMCRRHLEIYDGLLPAELREVEKGAVFDKASAR